MAKQYDTPLQLTSPHMVGQKVKDCQWLLAGHNRYDGLATYKDGAVDGDYGPLTAQATYKAKFWLGYPDKSLDRSFGQTLYEYLLKDGRPLPADYLSRRKSRLASIAANPGSKALEKAVTQIGVKESPPGSNRQPYGLAYGMNGVPWCAIFVSWAFAQTGYKTFRYSYVPFVHQDAAASRNRLSVIRTPRPGDAVCFTFGTRDSHIGFFEKWVAQGSTFQTVEGNSGSSSFNNGGEVIRGTRYISQVSAFVRVAA